MKQPGQFSRRVLLSVTGLSPQVVTETLYALAVAQSPHFMPTELVVITTLEGAESVRLTLRGNNPGWIRRLCDDYKLPAVRFEAANLRVLRGRDGKELADIRTDDDNMCAADMITETIRDLTADPDCALHVSMAGGRKTLGFFAAYALSLYGRSQDRLSHVLVSPRFEGNPDFYYPTEYSRVIYTRDRAPLDTKDAEVILADIPFVPLRAGLPEHLREGRTTYRESVEALRAAQVPARLTIDPRRGSVDAGGKTVRLTPVLIAYYAWVARYARAGHWIDRTEKYDSARDARHAAEFLAELGKLVDLAEHRTPARLREGMASDFLMECRSKLNARLEAVLDVGATPYQVHQLGKVKAARYGLTLPPEVITIVG